MDEQVFWGSYDVDMMSSVMAGVTPRPVRDEALGSSETSRSRSGSRMIYGGSVFVTSHVEIQITKASCRNM